MKNSNEHGKIEVDISRYSNGEAYRIEGFCTLYSGKIAVMAFAAINDKWSTSHSMYLPSNIGEAKLIIDCMKSVSDALSEELAKIELRLKTMYM